MRIQIDEWPGLCVHALKIIYEKAIIAFWLHQSWSKGNRAVCVHTYSFNGVNYDCSLFYARIKIVQDCNKRAQERRNIFTLIAPRRSHSALCELIRLFTRALQYIYTPLLFWPEAKRRAKNETARRRTLNHNRPTRSCKHLTHRIARAHHSREGAVQILIPD